MFKTIGKMHAWLNPSDQDSKYNPGSIATPFLYIAAFLADLVLLLWNYALRPLLTLLFGLAESIGYITIMGGAILLDILTLPLREFIWPIIKSLETAINPDRDKSPIWGLIAFAAAAFGALLLAPLLPFALPTAAAIAVTFFVIATAFTLAKKLYEVVTSTQPDTMIKSEEPKSPSAVTTAAQATPAESVNLTYFSPRGLRFFGPPRKAAEKIKAHTEEAFKTLQFGV